MWEAKAEYADGTTFEMMFPYTANGNYEAECNEQYRIECYLIERHPGCTWYSVGYVDE